MSDAVLLTAHGSVDDIDDMPAFLARIRHGRPAPAGLVEEIQRRYRAIGGSPLLRTTERQAELLAAELGVPVFVGMRLWRPELRDALSRAIEQGVERMCVLPLAPYSVHVYARAAQQALEALGAAGKLTLVAAQPFGTDEELVDAHARAVEPYLEGAAGETTSLILTAHSLPAAAIRAGDPYAEQVESSATAIGRRLGYPHRLAYQSQGADGGDWLGPTLRDRMELSRAEGHERVVVAPFGFLCDHVETLYDLDVEAAQWAKELGLTLARVPALNDSPGLVRALAGVARRALSD